MNFAKKWRNYMKIVVDNLAKQSLIDIYYYNYQYSLRNAIEINRKILLLIENLEKLPYIGRYIPEMSDNRFREIIYRKSRHSGYRIMYYISEIRKTIYIINIINCKQDFSTFLKLHKYFKNYYTF